MLNKMREPISALTHLIGAIIAWPITILLIYNACVYATVWHVVSFAIFGAALILLYSASTVYHMLPVSERVVKILRRVDHMMIFVLIAGTYTPVCLVPLRGVWGWTILSLVWIVAASGILLKILWIDAPRWLSSVIYLGMGWLITIAFVPLVKSIPAMGIVLLVLGGLTYSLGAVIYAVKWPNLKLKWFGFHEIFHLFVLGGSAFHIVFMFMYVMPA